MAAPAARRPTTTYRPRTPPTPPPRSSSFGGNRNSGHSGSRNTIGGNSIWNRLFGGDRSHGSSGGRTVTTTRRPITNRPRSSNRNGYYDTHVSYDRNGNRQWTFSGWKETSKGISKAFYNLCFRWQNKFNFFQCWLHFTMYSVRDFVYRYKWHLCYLILMFIVALKLIMWLLIVTVAFILFLYNHTSSYYTKLYVHNIKSGMPII